MHLLLADLLLGEKNVQTLVQLLLEIFPELMASTVGHKNCFMLTQVVSHLAQ